MSIKLANSLTIEQVRDMYLYVSDKIIESKPLLTQIDSAIGDGDHGIGMSVGFSKAKENLEMKDFSTVNEIFKEIGMSMIGSMGGASGVIFGTMFVGGVKAAEEKKELDTKLLAELFSNALAAIKKRGKAELGDKTMIDALQPAVESLKKSINEENLSILEAIKNAETAAADGVENTKDYVAKFGRSKSLGDRAIGHQDAGATSVWLIFKGMREWIEKIDN